MSHFKLISETRASDVVPVRKYVSSRTGLTVIIGGVEGPVVNGFFCLATEAYDDDGLPHTLEHLIFLGSKRYPFKGILDLLANRCLANGTNAWTDTDHTCYTIQTAGSEGMLTLLPIYLDHVLHPTLSEEGFITEVHHVDGEGEDAGVVYCEMQGRENNADSLCQLNLLRAIYPGGGYSSETGGIMENLRTSTNNKKVRDFHKKFYRAENLAVILTGQIEPEDVFRALEVVEDDIVANNAREEPERWQKPWQSTPPPPDYRVIDVQWPADTEDCGQVMFGWVGPGLREPKALKQLAGCALMLRYLCDTPTAPLQRYLIEIEDALAGDISYNIIENMSSLLQICLDNVPLPKLKKARDEALMVIKNIRSGEEALDMERVHRLVKKQLREATASLESDPHHTVAFQCIGDMLYSNSEEDFVSRLNSQVMLRELMAEPVEYWLNLLQTYFVDDLVTVLGSPSIDLQSKMAEEELNRIQSQREALGPEGLAEKAKIFQEAVAFNEREAPAGTLANVPIPSCSSLKCYSISTWASDCAEPCPHLDLSALPLYTRLHSIHTNFIYLNLVFDLTDVDQLTRKWLTMVVGAWGELPVRRGDQLVPYEQVVAELEEISVKHEKQIGFGSGGNFSVGTFGNHANFSMTCERSEYERVVNTLWEVFFSAQVTKERLLVIAQRLINDVAQVRRRGSKMVIDLLRDALYSDESNVHWNSVLRQQKFLTQVVEKLNAGGAAAEAVLAEAEAAYRTVSGALWLHIATDLDRYGLETEPWIKFQNNEVVQRGPKLHWEAEMLSERRGGCVVGVGGVESNYLQQLCPGPLSYSHADVAPLMLLLNYFTQLEGPMWRLIRGCGLSYGYGITPHMNEGRIAFSLYRATNVVEAYVKAKTIIGEYLSGGSFDEDLFVSAKSSAIFEVVENEKCPSHLAYESLMNYFRKVGDKYNRDLVCELSAVTVEQAQEVAKRWLPTLFEPTLAYTTVVCHPSKVADTQAAFLKIGVDLEAYESIESSHFNK